MKIFIYGLKIVVKEYLKRNKWHVGILSSLKASKVVLDFDLCAFIIKFLVDPYYELLSWIMISQPHACDHM